MFFRNLTFFRFPDAIARQLAFDTTVFDQQLAAETLKPVGPLELASRGWVSPSGQAEGEGRFAFWQPDPARRGRVWLTLGGEDRLLPGAVLNAELAKRLKALEQAEGRKPGGRARKRLKEDLVHELLPKSFVKPSRLDGYLDLDRGLLVVDTASRKAAEGFVSHLRRTLGAFPALPLNAELPPRAVLTNWLDTGDSRFDDRPEGVLVGDEAILKDAADTGATVRLTRQELAADEVARHLEAGKQVTRLGLYFGAAGDHVSFTLDEDLVVRKFKVLDAAAERLENLERDDLEAELMARFALMTGEIGLLFDTLERALKLSKLEA
jgi:recombination associated protein RdgC